MKSSNIFFSRLIKLDGRLREFNFRKIPALQDCFHVDVTDDWGRRIMFRIEGQECSQYNMPADSLPHWLADATPHLHSAVREVVA